MPFSFGIFFLYLWGRVKGQKQGHLELSIQAQNTFLTLPEGKLSIRVVVMQGCYFPKPWTLVGLPKSSSAGCCCTLAEHFASRRAQRAWKGWGWTECWHPSKPRGSPKSGRAAKHWSSTEATWAKQRQKGDKNIKQTIVQKERRKIRFPSRQPLQ